MNRDHRLRVAALLTAAVLLSVGLVIFAGWACPTVGPDQPCPGATTNRVVVVVLASSAAGLLVTPFAFLAEFGLRRRIVYRGAWGRAARRGLLAAAVVAVLAGLRLGGALSVAGALFVAVLALLAEWFAIRRIDAT